jgi:hypothetical protein
VGPGGAGGWPLELREIGQWSSLRSGVEPLAPARPPSIAGRASWRSGAARPVPEAPDGIAIIGADPESEGNYLQHYFDSRGVARLYKMSFEDRVWKLWRDEPDFSPLDFSQRFTGTFSDDGKRIAGRWEISHDGRTWEHDFDLTYRAG